MKNPTSQTWNSQTARMPHSWSLNERRQRSLALADERREVSGGMRATNFVNTLNDPITGELVWIELDVTSSRDESTRYRVTYHAPTDQAHCSCLAGKNNMPCWHAGQAILYGRMAADAYSPADRAATSQEQYQAWINESSAPL